jgi:hypothetical protein
MSRRTRSNGGAKFNPTHAHQRHVLTKKRLATELNRKKRELIATFYIKKAQAAKEAKQVNMLANIFSTMGVSSSTMGVSKRTIGKKSASKSTRKQRGVSKFTQAEINAKASAATKNEARRRASAARSQRASHRDKTMNTGA